MGNEKRAKSFYNFKVNSLLDLNDRDENTKIIANKNNRQADKSRSGDQNQQYSLISSFSYSFSRNSYYLIFRLFEANLALALQFIRRIQRNNVLRQLNHVFDGESVVGKIQGLFCRKINLFE